MPAHESMAGGSFPSGPAEILLGSPQDNFTYVGSVPFQFSTSTTPVDSFITFIGFTNPISTSAKIVFPGATGPVSDFFVIDLTQPLSSNPVFDEVFPPGQQLPDGRYEINMDYFDTEGRIPRFQVDNVLLDSGITQPASLVTSFSNSSLFLDVGFAEQPAGNLSARLGLQNMQTGAFTQLELATQGLQPAPPFSGNGNPFQLTFVWDGTSDPTVSTSSVVNWNGIPMTTGPYVAQLSYQDVLFHAPATNTTTFEFQSIGGPPDTETLPPTLTAPTPGDECNQFCSFQYSIPEAGAADSMFFYLNRLDSTASTQFHVTVPPTNFSTFATLDLSQPLDFQSPVTSAIGSNPPQDGVYSVSLFYQDQAGNPPASTTVSPVRFDSGVTQPPILTQPADGSVQTVSVTFDLSLVEQPSLNQAVQLDLVNAAQNLTTSFALNPLEIPVSTPVSFVWDGVQDPSLNNSLVAAWNGVPLVSGGYQAFLTYQDFFNNPAATAASNFSFQSEVVDLVTQPPLLISPTSGDACNRFCLFQYSIPEVAATDSTYFYLNRLDAPGSTQFHVFEPSVNRTEFAMIDFSLPLNFQTPITSVLGSNPPADGVYTVTLTYQDAAGNPPASTVSSPVRFDSGVTQPPILTQPVDGSNQLESVSFEVTFLEQQPPTEPSTWG